MEMRVPGQAGVVASVGSEDLANSEPWSGVNLGVIVQPDVLAVWIGLGMTIHRESRVLQS